jgi:hypothetical protein
MKRVKEREREGVKGEKETETRRGRLVKIQK